MSERKVLNKYYPPDFDPTNIPKMKSNKSQTFNIRIMAPFNMRCNTCQEYIYKGKKFNSRKENVEDEFYLGLRIFRFYIKCPKCVAEIAFKTDLKNTDYTLEAGATRLFEAEKLAQEMAEKERREKEDEELNNPMKLLENRTKASRNEIEQIDTLEELRELSTRQAKVNTETMLLQHREYEEKLRMLQEEEEEKQIKAIFGEKDGQSVKRLIEDSNETSNDQPNKKKQAVEKASDILTDSAKVNSKETGGNRKVESWQKSVGGFSNKNSLMNLVKKKDKKQNSCNSTDTVINSNGTSDASSVRSVTVNDTTTVNSTLTVSELNADNKEKSKSTNSTGSAPSALGMLGNYSDSDSD